MAPLNILAFAAVVIIAVLSLAASAQNVITDICNQVSCGRGTCKSGLSYAPLGFTCECDSGWRRTMGASSEAFQFLPCVIPNCSINTSCSSSMPVEAPLPSIIPTRNISLNDPCTYAYCGEGTCKNSSSSSDYNYTCECNSGARNLLNITYFPCYHDCAFGSSCSQLRSPVSSTPSSSSPSSSPVTDEDICDHVNCGRGSCKAGIELGFTCECDSGWRRTFLTKTNENQDQLLQFLPCVIPNCSMNTKCMSVPPPMPSITPITAIPNVSFTDPCAFAYCGEGTCKNASSEYTHTCECDSGATNLLNTTYFPCYRDCAFESSCSQLGLAFNSTSTSSSGSGSGSGSRSSLNSENGGHAKSLGKLSWVVVLLMTIVFITG